MINIKLKSASYDLVCLGEVLIDQIIDYRGNKHTLFGGSPANITINTRELGLNSLLCATVGDDDHGNYILNTLKSYDLDTSLIHKVNGQTSKVLMKQTVATPEPEFMRYSDYHITLSENLIKAACDTKIFHFSYWPLSREPAKDTLMMLVKKAKYAGALIAFDPNIHEGLINNESLVDDELLTFIKLYVDILKPSLDDAERLFGFKGTKEEYMDAFEKLGLKLVMMTLGKDGVYVSVNKKRYIYETETKTVVDATGAGDAFWSGFYAGLLNNLKGDALIKFAQQVSAITLSHLGAIAPLSDYKKKLERLI